MDNIGVRLLGDIALLQDNHQAALQGYLNGGAQFTVALVPGGADRVSRGGLCDGLHPLAAGHCRQPLHGGGADRANVVDGAPVLAASNVHGPEWAVDSLETAAGDWRTAEEIDFVDWVFNAAPALKDRAAWMASNEGLSYEWNAEQRAPYAQKSIGFIDRVTDTLSKKTVLKVKNLWGEEIWPWDRIGFNHSSPRTNQ
jgi:hypothetical protein